MDALAALGVLADHGLTHVAPHVAELLVGSLGGDPEAVVETARLLTVEQLSGAALIPDPLPAVPAVRHAVAPDLADLTADGRRLLLVAAVSVVDRTDALLRACGTDLDALLAGSAVGCLDLVAGHARIRDPRVRAVVHDDASVADRTAAHRSLAAAHAADGNDDVATWHRALASLAGEPDVAPRLVAVAERMLARGDAVWAQRVANEATSHAEGAVRAQAVAVAGRAALHAGHVADAADLLREALRTCEPEAADGLRTTLLVAVSHLTGQVPHELLDRDGSPWSRLVASVLQAARGVTEPPVAAPGPEAAAADAVDADLLALAEATVGLLAGEVPPVLPLPADGDPVRGAMLGVLRAVALAADGQMDAARCAVVSVLAALAPLPGDRAWMPRASVPAAAADRTCAMTPLVEAHVRLVEALVEMWAGNLEGALTAVTRASLRLPLGLCVHGAAAVVAGRASVLAYGERGVLADVLERLVPLPQSPAVRTGLLTDRALALLLQGEGAGAATLLELCAERGCPGELPLPTLRAAEARLVAGKAPAGASAGGRMPGAAGASSAAGAPDRRGRPDDGVRGELVAALMPTAHARLAVAEGDLDSGLLEARGSTRSPRSPVEEGLTRLVVGQALVRAGRPDEAADHLRAAAGLLEDAGARAAAHLATRALERLQSAPSGLRVAGTPVSRPLRRARPVPAAPWADALTEREAEVALVISDGASNRLAARHLGLSERTVEVHLTSIFRKVGVASRTELALLVSRSERAV
jgi:DNA-binding CsgD family transcriptional regulator